MEDGKFHRATSLSGCQSSKLERLWDLWQLGLSGESEAASKTASQGA